MDRSEKDNLYFIDKHVYNCPFCKRRNVKYSVTDETEFDNGDDTKTFVYQVTCSDSDCKGVSLHFSKTDLFEGRHLSYGFKYEGELDDHFIAHRPSTLSILDEDVPKKLRELISESEEARQSNLLTGASAALRKTIYELLVKEKALVIRNGTSLTDYKKSIHKLRDDNPKVDADLFNDLTDVQELTSDLVHEDSWKGWNSNTLKTLTNTVLEILEEMYAEPARRKRRKAAMQGVKFEVSAGKKANKKN